MADTKTTDAYTHFSAGYHLRAIMYTANSGCRWVMQNIEKVILELDRLGITYPRNQLEGIAKRLDELLHSSGEKVQMPEDLATQLRSIAECIHDTVKSQAGERRLVLLEASSVSTKLRELAKQGTLNTRQTYLFDETVSNLETGAYRSAVVMGWNLAYDMMRQWVFDDATRLAAFNTELAKIVDKAGKPRFDSVVDYPHFYDIGEKVVLDVCKGANLFGGNLYDDLRGYLRQRNSYAHASDSHPTVNQANALIDHLVDAIAKL